jgi:hypothetical protein
VAVLERAERRDTLRDREASSRRTPRPYDDGEVGVRRPAGRRAKRIAVDAETTQHGAGQVARTCAACRGALARGVYEGVVWHRGRGATPATAARAIAESGDERRMRAAPVPEGARVNR